MIRTLAPAIVGLVAIVGLNLYENIAIKDRWGEPGVEAAELGERFAQVPLTIGDWEGEDLPVDEITRKTAGAVKYVSRLYTNLLTGRQVKLWLIVGHSRDIVRHTPNICYPNSGFRQVGSQLRQIIELPSEKEAVFYTAKFEKENANSRATERVFWTFNHPNKDLWEAPESGPWWRPGGPRFHYGLANSLYKMYFTSAVRADEDTIEDSAAVEFAELMLPAVDKALFPTEAPNTDAPSTDASAATGTDESDAA